MIQARRCPIFDSHYIRLKAGNLEFPAKTSGRKFRIEPGYRFVRQRLINIIGRIPLLLEPNLEIDRAIERLSCL